MKTAVFIMAIMVMCIFRGSISEDKDTVPEPKHHKQCRFPKGNHGSVRTDGCIKSTCTNGKWKPKMRTDICCYKQQVHKPNTVLDTIVSADNCSSTTIGCGAVGQIEFNHNSCSIPATKQQVEKMEINLEQQIELVVEKIEKVSVNVTCGKQSDEIFKTVQEVDKKINEMNKSIEKNDDNLSGKVDDVAKITENMKNTTERQSEELSVKMNDVVQKIANDKITVKNHVNDLSRKIQNQTEELANNMKQKTELVVGKIHYLNQTIENQVDDLSNQLENQTEKIVIKMKQTEEQVKVVVGKFQILENQVDDLSNQVSRKLENQTEQILALENNVQEKLETQTEKIQELTKKQTEELAIKIKQTAQGKEVIGKIQALEYQVDDLSNKVSRNLENQTEEIVLKMNQTEEQVREVVGKFHNLNQTIENQVNGLSDQVSGKLENQTEEIVTKMKETEEQVKEVAGKFQTLENQMDDLSDNVSSKLENQTEQIQSQGKEVVGKIRTLEIQVDDLFEQVARKLETQAENIQELTKNQTEELAIKIKQTAQGKEVIGKIQALDNQVDDLSDKVSRNFEKQTEEIVMKMNQTEEQVREVVGIFHNLNQSIENQVNGLSDQVSGKLENQTEKIVMKMKETEEQVKEVAGKFQTLENQMDDLSEQVARKLETQAEQIQESTKNQAEKMQELTKNMENLTHLYSDQNEMSLNMMKTLLGITELLEKHTEDTPMVEGVLITGGYGSETSTELFLPSTGKTCSLHSLPDKRYAHSMDVVSNKIILCGGQNTKTSCLQFLPISGTGSWAYYATLAQDRYYHFTHSFEEDLLIMGGDASAETTELIGKGTQYNLQQKTTQACIIPDETSFILTSGWMPGTRYLKTVARYNMQGFVENLPDLAHGRRLHGCGSYMDKDDNKVLVVAGGVGHGVFSSTELLSYGATAWTAGENLPRELHHIASVNMGSHLLFIGGYDHGTRTIRGEVLKFNGSWTEVGMIKTARYIARATKIEIPGPGGLLNITGCS